MAINYASLDPLDIECLRVDGTTVNIKAIPAEIIIIMGSFEDWDLRGICVFITDYAFPQRPFMCNQPDMAHQ